MKKRIMWWLQFLINEWFMWRLFNWADNLLPLDVENGWRIFIEFILIIAFFFIGYAFTQGFENRE